MRQVRSFDGLDGHTARRFALQAVHRGALLLTQKRGDSGAGADHDASCLRCGARHLTNASHRLVRDRGHRDDATSTVTCGAGFREDLRQTRARALARHLHQAQLGDLEDVAPHLVLLEGGIERVHDVLLVSRIHHVDEVDDDDAPDVAESQLIDDLPSGLEVGREDGFLMVVFSDVPSGVHVDRRQGLSLVDDDVATGLEPHSPLEGAADGLLDAVLIEERLRCVVQLDRDRGRGSNESMKSRIRW